MNIIVRNMVYSDVEALPKAFAAQGWLMPSSIFENYYNDVLHKSCDMIIAEVKCQPAGYVRMEWLAQTGEEGSVLTPQIQEFIVLGRFTGTGVAEVMITEAERRISSKTGEAAGNTLMAIYGEPPAYPQHKCSYVLEGLLVGNEGKFIRAKSAADAKDGMVIRMRRS